MSQTTSIGEAVRRHRLRLGLSGAELELRSGVARMTIYRIEEGRHARPRMSTVRALAAALRVNVADLVHEGVDA